MGREINVDELFEVSDNTMQIVTEATFETEVNSFLLAIDSEIDAFSNRAILSQANKFGMSFDDAYTNIFKLASDKMIKRVQFMTSHQRGELFAKIEIDIKKHIKDRYPGRDEKETNELAFSLINATILEIKKRLDTKVLHVSKEV